MEANELRLGNIIHEWKTGTDIVVDLETFRYLLVCTNAIEDFKPIPLTEEWLLKFGVKSSYQHSREWYMGFDYDENTVFERRGEDFYYTGGEGCKLSKSIIYVHQLQNLYYALTGKELEIKTTS